MARLGLAPRLPCTQLEAVTGLRISNSKRSDSNPLRASRWASIEEGPSADQEYINATNNGGSVLGAQRQTVGAFVYGGGADFPVPMVSHVALRLEYRGLVYNAPNFGLSNLDTGTVTHTAQPSAGLVFRF